MRYDGVTLDHYGGDTKSWQRYTDRLPYRNDTHIDEDERSITLRLHESLAENAWHAVVLLHGNYESQPLDGMACIHDDYIIPFRTRPAVRSEPSGRSL